MVMSACDIQTSYIRHHKTNLFSIIIIFTKRVKSMDDGLMGTIDSDPHEKCVALGATGDIVADTESVEVFHRNRPQRDSILYRRKTSIMTNDDLGLWQYRRVADTEE